MKTSCCLALIAVIAVSASAWAAEKAMSDSPRRVVFLGDSITYGGQYIDYIEAYTVTRAPNPPGGRPEFLNLGIPSETVSGLSEPGHAGGQFPRPCLHERLARLLEKTEPNAVVACYGMNDGIYYPLGEDRFKAYQDGIRRLVDAAKASGAMVLLMTPPTFDPVPIKARTLPAGQAEYRQPFEGYDDVLARYSEWLLSQRSAGWEVGDIHGPMSRHLAERRKTMPAFQFAGDGVHANATGHMLMAAAVLEAWRVPPEVDAAVIDAAALKAAGGNVADLARDGEGIRFTWTSRRPMPMDPKWDAESVKLERFVERFNRHTLTVRGLSAARYQLREGDKVLGTVTREELAAGLDMLKFPDLSTNKGGAELLQLVRKRGRLLTDAYLNDIGHKRPGMAKGLPLDEARKQAADLDGQIRQLAGPVVLRLSLAAEQAAAAPPAPQAGQCVLRIGGKTVDPATHAIVIPEKATPQETFAAGDLAAHIEKLTGKRLAVVAEGTLGEKTPIVVGRCDATLAKLGVAVEFDKLGAEGIAIETKGPALVLAGNRRGVLYAVYTFLEDNCGCRWFTAGRTISPKGGVYRAAELDVLDPAGAACTVIPKTGTIEIGDLHVRYQPPLELRSTDYPCSRDADWAVRNKMNGTQTRLDEQHGGKVSYSHFVHTFNSILDPAKEFAAHPEYFSEVKGQRTAERTQLCLTNPKVIEIARKVVRQWIKESPDATIFSVSQNDWAGFCTCTNCRAVADREESQAGPLIEFVNAIADDIAADFPDKVIDTLAYQWSRKPPKSIRPRPNVCVRLCSIECCFAHPLDECEVNKSFVADIRGWNKLCNRLYIWDYVIDYSHSIMPFPNLRVLRPNIRFFIGSGVKGIYEEACYFTPGSELAELRTYIMAKTLWNPDYDTDKAIDEFLPAYYGPAAGPLRQYINLIHRQVTEHKDWHVNIWAKPDSPYLGAEVIAEAVKLFDEAGAKAAGDAVFAHRVEVARLPVLYVQIANSKPGDAAADASALLDRFERIARKEGVTMVREHAGSGALDVWLKAQRERLKLAPPPAPKPPEKAPAK